MKINGGATIWARQTIDSDIFYNKPDKWFKIWFYLVNKANHKDNKELKRSNCFMKYEWIMEKTKATKNEVDHCIRWLKSAKQITTQTATRGFIIEVLNYGKFQQLENYKSDIKSEAIGETKAKQKRNKSDTIYKNVKNVKNEKEIKHIVGQMNKILDRGFLPTAKKTQSLIRKRLSDGYTIENFKAVIKNRKERWENDERMNEYLCPTTLFAEENFEKYLQDAKSNKKKKGGRIL